MTSLEDKVKWTERANKKQDPLEFFRNYYNSSTTRSRLAKEDFSLYRILRRRELLNEAIPDIQASNRISRFGNDTVAYYQ